MIIDVEVLDGLKSKRNYSLAKAPTLAGSVTSA